MPFCKSRHAGDPNRRPRRLLQKPPSRLMPLHQGIRIAVFSLPDALLAETRAGLQHEKPKRSKKLTPETPFGARNDPPGLRKRNPSRPRFQAPRGAQGIAAPRSSLPGVLLEQPLGDSQFLCFLSPFVDLKYLGIPVKPLYIILIYIAIASVKLNRLVDNPNGHFS